MSFDIVWTEAFAWWEKPLGYYRLLKARKNYGTRVSFCNPFVNGQLFHHIPGYQERLRLLHNIHENKRCFIIGNGPSLGRMDLSPLKNEITIGSNGIYKLFPKMGFHTTYLTMEDIAQVEDRRHEIKSIKGPIKIFALHNAYCVPPDNKTLFMNVYLHQDGEQKFSENCSSVAFLGSTITYINLQLAFYFGCNPVYLIGMDFNYGEIQKTLKPGKIIVTDNILNELVETHFIPDYHRLGNRFGVPHVEKQYRSFQKAQEVYEVHDRQIYNAGHESKLDIFEKVDYEALFNISDPADDRFLEQPESLESNDEILVMISPKYKGPRWKTYYDKAAWSRSKGRNKRAIRYLEKSISSKPNTPAFYLMAIIKKEMGKTNDAVGLLNRIINSDSNHSDKNLYAGAHYLLGQTSYQQRDLIEAQFHLEQCLDIIPNHQKAFEYLERIKTECEVESLLGKEIGIPVL